MNGYDAWKLASPPEDQWRTCICGESEEDHNGGKFDCGDYRAGDYEDGPDPDRAYDERREREAFGDDY